MAYHITNHKQKKMAILLISPETGRLPDDMGPRARYISGKSGGLGKVISTLCEGLTRPSGWKPGKVTLKPGPDLVGKIWEVWKTDMAFD